jgi:hypothetical protein
MEHAFIINIPRLTSLRSFIPHVVCRIACHLAGHNIIGLFRFLLLWLLFLRGITETLFGNDGPCPDESEKAVSAGKVSAFPADEFHYCTVSYSGFQQIRKLQLLSSKKVKTSQWC